MDGTTEKRTMRGTFVYSFVGALGLGAAGLLIAAAHYHMGINKDGDKVRPAQQQVVGPGKTPQSETERPPGEKAKTGSGSANESVDFELAAFGIRFKLIGPGRFKMGSPTGEAGRENNELEHEVSITAPYYIGIHEVTQAQYRNVMGVKNPSHFSASGEGREDVEGLSTEDFPVECVTWLEAANFCRRLSDLATEKEAGRSYFLPTEAEWEYACRAGTRSVFHFGSSLSEGLANALVFDGKERRRVLSLGRTAKCGSPSPNAWGLFDMHGNVWEWCSDWYDDSYYSTSPGTDPPGPDRSPVGARVVRGGSWLNEEHLCRSAARSYRRPDEKQFTLGFRLVMRKIPSRSDLSRN